MDTKNKEQKIFRCPLRGRMGQCPTDGWCIHVKYKTYSEAEYSMDCTCEPRKCVISMCDPDCLYCEGTPQSTFIDTLMKLATPINSTPNHDGKEQGK